MILKNLATECDDNDVRIYLTFDREEACSALLEFCERILTEAKKTNIHEDCDGDCDICIFDFISKATRYEEW